MCDRQSEALRKVLESERLDLHTGTVGKVRAFSAARQTCEVELQIQRVLPAADEDDDDTTEDYPILPEVPIVYPSGGGFAISWPLSVGDFVWIAFAESDLGQWRATGEKSNPSVQTRHGLSGAVAYPGIHHRGNPNANATANSLRIEKDGGPVLEIVGSEIRVGGSGALAKSTQVQTQLDALAADLATVNAAIPSGVSVLPAALTYSTAKAANAIATTTTKGA